MLIYTSLALFVLALVSGLFALAIPSGSEAVFIAEIMLVGSLGSAVILFLIDRVWGESRLRRGARVTQSQLDLERAEGEGMIGSPHSQH